MNKTTFSFKPEELTQALNATLNTTSDNDIRQLLETVHVEAFKNEVSFESTDSYHATQARLTATDTNNDGFMEFCFDPYQLRKVLKAIDKKTSEVKLITTDDGSTAFEVCHTEVSKLYPVLDVMRTLNNLSDYQALYPDVDHFFALKGKRTAVFHLGNLHQTLKELAKYKNDNVSRIILDIYNHSATFTAGEDEELHDQTLTCDYPHDSFRIGFNALFMLDVLEGFLKGSGKSIKTNADEYITLEFLGERKPIMLSMKGCCTRGLVVPIALMK